MFTFHRMVSKTFTLPLSILIFAFSLVFYSIVDTSNQRYAYWNKIKRLALKDGTISETYFDTHIIYKKMYIYEKTITYDFRVKDTEGNIYTFPFQAIYRPGIPFVMGGIPYKEIDTIISKQQVLEVLKKNEKCINPILDKITFGRVVRTSDTYRWFVPLADGNECLIEPENGESIYYVDFSKPNEDPL